MCARALPEFPRSMETFGRVLVIEARLRRLIGTTRVPYAKTRVFLTKPTLANKKSTELYKFFAKSFEALGIGRLVLRRAEGFEYVFENTRCRVAKLYPWASSGVAICHLTARALQEFFDYCLGIPASVREEACVNAGAGGCVFSVSLQPFSTYAIILDEDDVALLERLKRGEALPAEYRERLQLLKEYLLLDERERLTANAGSWLRYVARHGLKKPKPREPRWAPKKHAKQKIAKKVSETFEHAFREFRRGGGSV